MFLAADIGGTKTLVALGDQGGIRFQRRFLNDDHAGPAALIAAFLREAEAAGLPARAAGSCLALAGPVSAAGAAGVPGSRASLTNRDWQVDAAELSRTLPLGPVSLLNDFAASAASVATLAAEECLTLQAGVADRAAPSLVLGPGTGLGVAAWLPDSTGTGQVLPSEGGHIGYAPANPEQRAFLAYLAERHRRVTVERIVSGPGLVLCHDFCARQAGMLSLAMTPEEISRRALAGGDPVCAHALDLFLAIFGAYAGDMALCFLARGGIHLVGGVVAKILPRLATGPFIAAFNDKAEHAGVAAAIPVVAVRAEDLALRGALATACKTG